MAKFKIGDKVRLVSPGRQHIDEGLVKGDILTVEEDDEIPYCSCVGKYNHIKDRSTRAIMQHRLELYEEPTKRVPKVGDRVRSLVRNARLPEGSIFQIRKFRYDVSFHNMCGDGSMFNVGDEGVTREFYDEVEEPKKDVYQFHREAIEKAIDALPPRYQPRSPVPPYGIGVDDEIRKCKPYMHQILQEALEEPTQPLSTTQKIMSKLEQFRSNLHFTDKKMGQLGKLVDSLEGYQNDIDSLVFNLELISGELTVLIEDIEEATDEEDRVAAIAAEEAATEYLAKVSTLSALASMLSNAKALDKFTDKQ